jgi:hypothetical protein
MSNLEPKPPAVLYKYLPAERINLVKGRRIRFTAPISFNDPFDCRAAASATVASTVEESHFVDSWELGYPGAKSPVVAENDRTNTPQALHAAQKLPSSSHRTAPMGIIDPNARDTSQTLNRLSGPFRWELENDDIGPPMPLGSLPTSSYDSQYSFSAEQLQRWRARPMGPPKRTFAVEFALHGGYLKQMQLGQ